MTTDPKSGSRGRFLAAAIPIVLILLPFGISVVQHVFAEDVDRMASFVEMPKKPDPSNPEYKCVLGLGSDYMRYHHMDLLKEMRDDAVREGIRSDVTFDRCRECHGNRATFCDKCHDVVDLEPDCFDCHYYPK